MSRKRDEDAKKRSKGQAGRGRAARSEPAENAESPGLSPRARELVALGLCGFALYAMLCLATFRMADLDGTIPTGDMRNLGGAVGYYLSFGFTRALGLAGWIPFLILLAYALLLFMGRSCERLTIKLLGVVCFSAILSIVFAGQDGLAGVRDATPFGAGGVFGSVVSPKLYSAFGGTGRMLILMFGAIVALLIATEWMFSELLLRAYGAVEPPVRRLFGRAVAAAGVGEVEPLEEARAPPARRRSAVAVDEQEDPCDDELEDEPASAEEELAEDEPADDEAHEDDSEETEEEPDLLVAGAEDAPEAAEQDETDDAQGRLQDEDRGAAEPGAADPAEPEGSVAAAAEEEPVLEVEPIAPARAAAPAKPKVRKPRRRRRKAAAQSNLPFQDYPFPPTRLFQEPGGKVKAASTAALNASGAAIVNKLANFKIDAALVSASVGPTITLYELKLAESIRVTKIIGFEPDLAAALEAESVRIVAPIPGKATVGIEVPNPKREMVLMRELLEIADGADDMAIPLCLGKDSKGEPIIEDLSTMPHLLVAGTTGSGKSVCINTILLSILMTRTPEQVKLILVDPKQVEMQGYRKVPHLCCEVVTNMKKAPSVLQWAVDEMENRYSLLSAAGTKDIKSYNRLGEAQLAKRLGRDPDPDRVRLSYVVIVVDEFGDLMNVAAKDIENLIQRLAQKSRAVGMHVILATQRPSSEVITGVIKANLPCQIAFKVNRKIDSRVILDNNGAEKLLGNGDMLYQPPGGASQMRAQGTFVSEEEQLAVVSYLEEQGQAPDFNQDLMQRQSSSRPSGADRDELYYQAVEVIVGQQRGSATLLQRALEVGYTRATRLLEMMEDDAIVGPFVGSKAREVLLTIDEWRARREAEEQAAEEAASEYEDEDLEDDDYEDEDEACDGDEDADEEPDVEVAEQPAELTEPDTQQAEAADERGDEEPHSAASTAEEGLAADVDELVEQADGDEDVSDDEAGDDEAGEDEVFEYEVVDDEQAAYDADDGEDAFDDADEDSEGEDDGGDFEEESEDEVAEDDAEEGDSEDGDVSEEEGADEDVLEDDGEEGNAERA